MDGPLFKGLNGLEPDRMLMAPCIIMRSDLNSYPNDDDGPGSGMHTDHDNDDFEWVATDTPTGLLADSQAAPHIDRETLDRGFLKALGIILGVPEMQLFAARGSPVLLVLAAHLRAEVARIFRPGANLDVDSEKDEWVNVEREDKSEDELSG